jgi:glycerol-3-phosphate acyltransferase PlsY
VLNAVAFAAIVGHVFPVWFGFRGGKGGATAAGLVCYLAPAGGLAMLGAWVLIAFTTGFVGLATIGAALVAVIFLAFTTLPNDSGLFLFGCATAALVIYAHRSNIRRMLDGTESRFSSPAARWLRRGQ